MSAEDRRVIAASLAALLLVIVLIVVFGVDLSEPPLPNS